MYWRIDVCRRHLACPFPTVIPVLFILSVWGFDAHQCGEMVDPTASYAYAVFHLYLLQVRAVGSTAFVASTMYMAPAIQSSFRSTLYTHDGYRHRRIPSAAFVSHLM